MPSITLKSNSPTLYSENTCKKARKIPRATTIWLCFLLTRVLTSLLSSGGFRRLPRYLLPHALQTLDQLALHLAAVPLMEELLSLFLLFLPCFGFVRTQTLPWQSTHLSALLIP